MGQNGTGPRGPRCIALVGPFQSGKTTLLEAILARTGAMQRQGTVEAGTTVGDASKEARSHKMSVEASVATTSFMGDSYTFIDCPGSIEFIHDMRSGAAGGRRGRRGLRGRREEGAAAATDPARIGRPQHSALPVSQQDRQGRQARARDAQAVAAGLARAAAVAANPDLARRHHFRFRRSRARARLCLQGARAVRGHRAHRRGRAIARRKRASPCWRRWPITTTS